jgi:hypothetical protein
VQLAEVAMKRWILVGLVVLCVVATDARADDCAPVPRGDVRWHQLRGQYIRIERATIANDAKQLFALYAPGFEAHMFNGQVWSFKQSATYSTAGFDQVKENLSISNTILDLISCGATTVKATVLQQWSRRQLSEGQLRLFQTTTVQDETWTVIDGEWKRALVDNERPGAWLVDLKRVDPMKSYDPAAPPFDPDGLLRGADHAK